MSSSDPSINTGLHNDPYATSTIEGFLTHFNKKLEAFVEILQHDQETLIKGSADEISQSAQNKLTYIQTLSDFIANYFNNTSNSNSLEESLKMMNVICIEKKIQQWNESLDLIHFCRELSDENSILLANRLKSTNNALDTLYSLTGSQQTKTYDDSGHSKHSHISRQLASV
ncbi:MAG: flagellar export chaperone FlgN [Gammaproteobacteria bacterium]